MVNDLAASSNYLADLMQNTLDLTKLEQGKVELNKHYYSIEKLAEIVAKLNKEKAKSKEIVLRTDYSKEIPSLIELDNARTAQIVMNLITNAIKFTPKGGIVEIKTEWEFNTPRQSKDKKVKSGSDSFNPAISGFAFPKHQSVWFDKAKKKIENEREV